MLLAALAALPGAALAITPEEHQHRLDALLSTMQQVIKQGPYSPNVDSLNRYTAPDWYADAKLGIFIHYGLFSVPGYSGVGCWYGNQMYIPTTGAYEFHREQFGPQDKFGYKDFAPYLTGSKFNADEWVSLFKEAGARFVVPVSCFHDGFAMWNSNLTDWNAVKTGPRRDYDGLLAMAARKQGMKFGVAWHAFFRPNFFAPGRHPGTDMAPPNSGAPWSIYGPSTVDRPFVDDSLGRLAELVDGYRPDLVWFDFDTGGIDPADLMQFEAFYFNRASYWNKEVAVNDKHEDRFPSHSIVLEYERGNTLGLRRDLWQTDTSVSWRDWSYIRNDSFKTVDEIVRELVDIVSKNGVLLLDVGPKPDGAIPPEPQALLRGLGAWLNVNGEAIYSTRPCWALGFGEGNHNAGGGGFSDKAVQYDSHDFRFTQKGNSIFVIAMDWPDVEDSFLIRSINARSILASGGISRVEMLGAKAPLDWKLTDDGLAIRRPSERPCNGPVAFKLTLTGVGIESLDGRRIDDKTVRVNVRMRNFDPAAARPFLSFYDNDTPVGGDSIEVPANGNVTRSVTLNDAFHPGVAIVNCRVGQNRPFTPRADFIRPGKLDAIRKFSGDFMLAGKDIGKLSKLTVSLWTQTTDLRDAWTALFNTSGWEPGGMHVQYLKNGSLQVSLRGSDGVSVDRVSKSAPGLAEGWQLVTITYDAAAGRAVIYIAGKRDADMTIEKPMPVDLGAFNIGGWSSGGRRFVGQMADIRLYDRVLNPAEIESLPTGRQIDDGLLAVWGCINPNNRDETGHGHDLTEAR